MEEGVERLHDLPLEEIRQHYCSRLVRLRPLSPLLVLIKGSRELGYLVLEDVSLHFIELFAWRDVLHYAMLP